MDKIPENWNWKKFFIGFFDGKNYAKAIVIGTCQAIVVVIVACVFLTAKNIILRNTGTVITNESHTKSETKNNNLFTLLKIG